LFPIRLLNQIPKDPEDCRGLILLQAWSLEVFRKQLDRWQEFLQLTKEKQVESRGILVWLIYRQAITRFGS
jgi:hypothetical protein